MKLKRAHFIPGLMGKIALPLFIAIIFSYSLQGKQLEHKTEMDGIFYAVSGHYRGLSVTNVSEDRIAADKGHVTIPGVVYYNNSKYAVTDIEQEAFTGKSGLRSVKLPGCVISIHDAAFAHCENLEKVELNEGLRNIYATSFAGCTKLRHITIPYSVEYIGSRAFQGCSNLSSVVFYGEKRQGKDVFSECPSLSQSNIKTVAQKPAPQPKVSVKKEKNVKRAVEPKTAPAQRPKRSIGEVLPFDLKFMSSVVAWEVFTVLEIILVFLAFGFKNDKPDIFGRYPIEVYRGRVWRRIFSRSHFVAALVVVPLAAVMIILQILRHCYSEPMLWDADKLLPFVPGVLCISILLGAVSILPQVVKEKLLKIPYLTITENYIKSASFSTVMRDRGSIYFSDVEDIRLVSAAPMLSPLREHWFLKITYQSKRRGAEWIRVDGLTLEPQEIYDMIHNLMVADAKSRRHPVRH